MPPRCAKWDENEQLEVPCPHGAASGLNWPKAGRAPRLQPCLFSVESSMPARLAQQDNENGYRRHAFFACLRHP
jgi:hypothetical protein